jgi:hypothetical protein
MDASCCPDLKATPAEILPWVVMRWSVAVTFDEARAPLGVEPQRQGPAKALVRTTPVLLGLVALVTLLALRLRQTAPLPVAATAWSHTVEPTVAACLVLVRRQLGRARYVGHSPPEAESRPLPREALELLSHGVPLAA